MTETTVTMSLERFKVLEGIEHAYNLLKKGEDFVVYYNGYDEELRVFSKDEATHKAIDDFAKAQKRLDDIKSRIYQYEDTDKKSKIKEFMRDLLY